MGSVPCIRGLRIPVVTILEMLAEGMTEQELLATIVAEKSREVGYSVSERKF